MNIIERLRQGELVSVHPQPPITLQWSDGSTIDIGPSSVETRRRHPLCDEAADRIEDLVDALRLARASLIALAESGTERIRDLGGECDAADRTYSPIVAHIDVAIATATGPGR